MRVRLETPRLDLSQTTIDQEFERIVQREQQAPANPEKYGQSLSGLRRLGRLAILGEQHEDDEAAIRRHELALFESSIGEMIKIDSELAQNLEVTRWDEYALNETGEVIGYDGKTTMVELTRKGYEYSLAIAQEDKRMQIQADRNYHDWQNAKAVNQLRPGQVRIVASLAPEEVLTTTEDKKYWRMKGYMPDQMTAFLQVYYRDGDTLKVGNLSVDGSNKKAWRRIFRDFGVCIPRRELTDNWLQYAIMGNVSSNSVPELAEKIREMYYSQIKDHQPRKTIDDYLLQYRDVLDQNFSSLYEDLARSAVNGAPSELMKDVARGVLKKHAISANKMHHLDRFIRNGDWDDEIIRQLEESIRYATVEEIRARITGKSKVSQGISQSVIENFEQHFGEGVDNGREYGACGGATDVTGKAAMELFSTTSPQEAFGDQHDRYGSLYFDCPRGHKNKRPFGRLIPHCQKCGVDVRC